jgi:hypothetical protein
VLTKSQITFLISYLMSLDIIHNKTIEVFAVLTPVVIKISVFWDVTRFSPLKVNRYFGWTRPLHLQSAEQGPNIKHISQQFLYYCLHIRCRGNLFAQPLHRNGSSIAEYVLIYEGNCLLSLCLAMNYFSFQESWHNMKMCCGLNCLRTGCSGGLSWTG